MRWERNETLLRIKRNREYGSEIIHIVGEFQGSAVSEQLSTIYLDNMMAG